MLYSQNQVTLKTRNIIFSGANICYRRSHDHTESQTRGGKTIKSEKSVKPFFSIKSSFSHLLLRLAFKSALGWFVTLSSTGHSSIRQYKNAIADCKNIVTSSHFYYPLRHSVTKFLYRRHTLQRIQIFCDTNTYFVVRKRVKKNSKYVTSFMDDPQVQQTRINSVHHKSAKLG